MTDYTRGTGNSATMMIRDTGSWVEFWINSNNSVTFNNQLPWAYVINGNTSAWQSFRYSAGAGWQRLGSWNITYDQNVTFKLGDTGTSGFGGPTDFTVFIPRATVPGKPGPFVITNVTDTTISGDASGGSDGGSPILEWRIGYGTSPSQVQYYKTTDGAGRATVTGLARGTTYYFWFQGRNAKGWGPFSDRTSAKTWDFPAAPSVPVISEITQLTAKATFSANANGGTAITGYQLGYGTNSTTPETTIDQTTPVFNLTGLIPGKQYYFWGKTKNAVGYSSWSAAGIASTIAGAFVKVGTIWKKAVPYVNVNGVWKVARPWARSAGTWKETS